MRMRGTTIGGKAAAGATDIMEASASGVKDFFHLVKEIGQNGKSIRHFLSLFAFRAGTAHWKAVGCGILAEVSR
jgi:hypothetical protein